jgi:hypothetical protein
MKSLSTFDKFRVCPCSFILEGYLDTKVSVAKAVNREDKRSRR